MSLLTTLLSTSNSGGGGGSVPGVILAPVIAASTTNLTVTYNNGFNGIGATLTNAGAQAAFALDGVTLTAGQRVLIKDQSTQFQNGVYSVTVVGSGASNWVLTRTTDFDQPGEMSQGVNVSVVDGSTQGGSIWIQNDIVADVGIDSVAFERVSGSSGNIPFQNMQVFTSSGTFTPSSTTTSVFVEVWGGGGGGGGSDVPNTGSGGAGAGYSCGFVTVTPSVGVTVTVGAKGLGGGSTVNGTGGTNSSFAGGTTLTGGGGGGGVYGIGVAGGGTGVGGTLNISGRAGQAGTSIQNQGGAGGNAFKMTGASPVGTTTGSGLPAAQFGCGGNGGALGGAFSGGDGSPGLVIVYY